MRNRVVVTGLGCVTPVGIGKDIFWNSLLEGRSGIDRITRFDPTDYATQIAGEVKDFDPSQFIDKKEAKRMDRFTQYAVASAKMAIEDAKLDLEVENRQRIGTIIGTGIGGMETLSDQSDVLANKGPGRMSPFFVPMMIANMAAGQVAITFGLQGPATCVVTACATGTNAIGDAFRMIRHGYADVMVAGGTEAAIIPLAVGGFCAMKAMSTRNDEPQKASRPFERDRDGFVMGDGAGVVVLESLEHAQKRGAHILAEVVGYGANDDAYHITAPAPEGLQQARCMAMALEDAGLKPQDVDYINAHGTSTPLNDKGETIAIKNVFGDYAKKLAINSTKSMTGHLLGAAGGVEFIVCVQSILNSKVHPTINLENQDPELDLDYVPHKARAMNVNVALSNNFGFGGHNATIIVKKFQG
jgi:3-oxoacyl-[acyl-carrier-protein] synthase II